MKVRHRIASRRFPKPQDFLKAPTAIDQTSYVEDPLKPNEPYRSPIHLRAPPLQYSSCRMSLDPNLREDRIRRLVSVLGWGLEIAGALLLLIHKEDWGCAAGSEAIVQDSFDLRQRALVDPYLARLSATIRYFAATS